MLLHLYKSSEIVKTINDDYAPQKIEWAEELKRVGTSQVAQSSS
jgi:hypothetical protein